MRTKSLSVWATVLLAVSMMTVSCDGDDPTTTPTPTVASVQIDPPQASLVVGDSVLLTARAVSADDEPLIGLTVTWTSQTPERATLTPRGARGRVDALRAGSTVIRASVGGKTGQAEIAISNPTPLAGVAGARGGRGGRR